MFNKKLITDKNELLLYKQDIIELFEICFNAALDINLWNWAYIDNVCGNPVVSLVYHGNRLVGHYAIVPIRLQYGGKIIQSGLSMTTMVDAAYRRHGLFIQQANEVYDKAKELGYLLVYGFPNLKSAPGFKKRLNWIVNDESCVVKIKGEYIKNKEKNMDNKICFNCRDEQLLEWRLSKPGQKYIRKGNLILKKFKKNYDIVFHQNDFQGIKHDSYYNMFVEDKKKCKQYKSFDYAFGYKIINENLADADFKIDLIMSDVF